MASLGPSLRRECVTHNGAIAPERGRYSKGLQETTDRMRNRRAALSSRVRLAVLKDAKLDVTAALWTEPPRFRRPRPHPLDDRNQLAPGALWKQPAAHPPVLGRLSRA